MNIEAGQQSGSARVYDNAGDFGRAIPTHWRGVALMLNDSDIDTTNPDLPLSTGVVDNVQAARNVTASPPADFVGLGIVPITHLRNQINTDMGSGRGTHLAEYFRQRHFSLIAPLALRVLDPATGQPVALTHDNFERLGAPQVAELMQALDRLGSMHPQKCACRAAERWLLALRGLAGAARRAPAPQPAVQVLPE